MTRGSSVSIVTRLWTWSRFNSQQGHRFSHHHRIQIGSGTHPA